MFTLWEKVKDYRHNQYIENEEEKRVVAENSDFAVEEGFQFILQMANNMAMGTTWNWFRYGSILLSLKGTVMNGGRFFYDVISIIFGMRKPKKEPHSIRFRVAMGAILLVLIGFIAWLTSYYNVVYSISEDIRPEWAQ